MLEEIRIDRYKLYVYGEFDSVNECLDQEGNTAVVIVGKVEKAPSFRYQVTSVYTYDTEGCLMQLERRIHTWDERGYNAVKWIELHHKVEIEDLIVYG